MKSTLILTLSLIFLLTVNSFATTGYGDYGNNYGGYGSYGGNNGGGYGGNNGGGYGGNNGGGYGGNNGGGYGGNNGGGYGGNNGGGYGGNNGGGWGHGDDDDVDCHHPGHYRGDGCSKKGCHHNGHHSGDGCVNNPPNVPLNDHIGLLMFAGCIAVFVAYKRKQKVIAYTA